VGLKVFKCLLSKKNVAVQCGPRAGDGVTHGKDYVYMDKKEKGRRTHCHSVSVVVPKLCSANPKGSLTNCLEIRLYISVVAALKFTFFLIKGIIFSQK
jgi:hypothetical protein